MTNEKQHDQHTAGIAAYISDLALKRRAVTEDDASAAMLDEQIRIAINDVMSSDPTTLDDALALVWLGNTGLCTFGTDRANGFVDEMRGISITERALAKLDQFLTTMGAKWTSNLQATNPRQIN